MKDEQVHELINQLKSMIDVIEGLAFMIDDLKREIKTYNDREKYAGGINPWEQHIN